MREEDNDKTTWGSKYARRLKVIEAKYRKIEELKNQIAP
jgi:hypothetical protein